MRRVLQAAGSGLMDELCLAKHCALGENILTQGYNLPTQGKCAQLCDKISYNSMVLHSNTVEHLCLIRLSNIFFNSFLISIVLHFIHNC